MKKPGLVLKIAVIANAILLLIAFVGCPSRRESIFPHIAPVPIEHNHIIPHPIASPPAHFERLLTPTENSPPSSPDSKNE